MHLQMRRALIALTLALWPIVYFVHAWWPAAPWSQAIGNDFEALYYTYKIYLLDLLAHGTVPLWSPMEGAGYPFYSSPFTQTLYPLNLLLMLFYDWRDGYSQFDHQFFTLTGLSIYAIGLYLWLRTLESNGRAVFATVLICTVSFKLTELLRFPNAIHCAAWMPWLLYGLTLARFERRHRLGLLVLFTASVMLLTAGYPYFAYYLLFLLPPYIVMLWWKPHAFMTTPSVAAGRYLVSISLAFLAAIVLLMPYLLKVVLLTGATADRRGDDYQYSTSEPFSALDTLGSLLYPPVASAEGWYFISTLALVLIAAWVVQTRMSGTPGPVDVPVLTLVATGMVATLITWGGDWYLFDLLWHYLPGFSSLRIWGRLNIILVPVLALLLARALAFAERRFNDQGAVMARQLTPFALCALGVLVIQTALYLYAEPHSLWTLFFADNSDELGFILRSAAVLAATGVTFALVPGGWHSPTRARALLTVVVLGCMVELYPVGSIQWMKTPDSSDWQRTRLDIPSRFESAFETPRVRIYDTLDPSHYNVGWVQNWYFQRYTQFDRSLFIQAWERRGGHVNLSYGAKLPMGTVVDADGVQAYEKLMGLATGQRLFVSRSLDHATPRAFMSDAGETARHVDLQPATYTGDELTLKVRATEPVFLSFIDNWDPDWRACVFTREVPVAKLFGTFKALAIPRGEGLVRFRYSPWPFETRAPCEP